MSSECSPSECTCRTGNCADGVDDSSDPPPTMPDLGQGWMMSDLDDEWEAHAEAKLETVEFDTDLGVELSRDAMALARGELTEAEFHEKHHDAIAEEFGVDDRPTQAALEETELATREDGTPLPGVPSIDGSSHPTRRGLMKAIGGAAAAGAAAGLAGCLGDEGGAPAGAAADEGEGGDVQLGMVIDTDRCIACMLCVEGCKEENDTDRGTHWMHVFRYEEEEHGDVDEGYLPRPCQHCSEPSCTYVCPTQARYKREDNGLVLTNYDTCIGCKYCEVACPYGVNFLGKGESTEISSGFTGSQTDEYGTTVGGSPPEGVMGKCTFCVHRQDDSAQRGTTACEDACPVDAIHFGDMNDEDSEPRQYLRENRGESRFKLLEELGNRPNVVYLGNEPSVEARPTDGPYTYEDLGMETLADDGGDD